MNGTGGFEDGAGGEREWGVGIIIEEEWSWRGI